MCSFFFDSGFGNIGFFFGFRILSGFCYRFYVSEGLSGWRFDVYIVNIECDMEEELERIKVVKVFWDLC